MSFEQSTICPHCGVPHELARALAITGVRPPTDGDVALCVNCGHFCVFDQKVNGCLRKANEREAAEMAEDPRSVTIREEWVTRNETRRKSWH